MTDRLNAVEYAARIRKRSVGPILIAEAQSAFEDTRRVVAFSVVGQQLKLLDDQHLPEDEPSKLQKILLAARSASCDAKDGEDPRWVWAVQGDSLCLWGDLKLRVGARTSGIEIRGATGTRTVPRNAARSIRVELSEIWDTVRVVVTTADGPVGLVSKTDRSVLRDPAYDEESLMRDTRWVVDFARGVASRLRVPLELPEDLQAD